jgi:hypothetical protein
MGGLLVGEGRAVGVFEVFVVEVESLHPASVISNTHSTAGWKRFIEGPAGLLLINSRWIRTSARAAPASAPMIKALSIFQISLFYLQGLFLHQTQVTQGV